MVDYSAEDLAALATAIYGEARGEIRRGQDAVAHVVIGRSKRANVSIPDVVYGSVDPDSGQYSFTNPGEYSKTIGDPPRNDPDGWARAIAVAKDALTGRTKDPTGGASHYFNPRVNSKQSDKWASKMEDLGVIGNHQFFRESDGGVGITRAAARPGHRREPGKNHIVPGMFGHHVMSAFDGYRGPAIPFPSERGVSQQAQLTSMQMYEPGSGNMGLAERQAPAWSDQFAPGPKAAPSSAIPQPTRSDYPTSPTNPTPWQDSFTPASQYARRSASPGRMNAVPMTPKPPLTSGSSDTAKAYRRMAGSMATAGIGGLDGRAAKQSQRGIDQFGPAHGPSTSPSVTDSNTQTDLSPSGPLPNSIRPSVPPYTGAKKQIFDHLMEKQLESLPRSIQAPLSGTMAARFGGGFNGGGPRERAEEMLRLIPMMPVPTPEPGLRIPVPKRRPEG